MPIPLTVNGVIFDYPETDDQEWGAEATDWASAVTSGMLQKAGGTFQLLAETDFGTAFGLKSLYYKTRTTNPATAGQFRLARADVISWRNQANGANLDLGVSASNVLQFNGVDIVTTTLTSAHIFVGNSGNVATDTAMSGDITIDNTGVTAIGTNKVTDTMLRQSAALSVIGRSANSTGNVADISAGSDGYILRRSGTAIGFGTIVNAGVDAAAAIAFSKLASLTSAHILVGSAGNVATDVAVSGDITISNAGVTAIGSNKVTNAMLATVATATFKGRTTAGTGNVEDLTATQATALLNAMVGDSGSGGTKGLVPAPSTGDATKFLNGGGAWSTPSGAGDVTGPASATDNAVTLFDSTTGKLIKNSTLISSGGALTVPGALRSNTSLILEDPGAGTNTFTIAAGTVSSSYQMTFPAAVAAASSSVLVSSNAGVISYVPAVSTNTASQIVLRDGSGNFSAGTISAALTGTASGNTTYSANNHGVVISSATNAMTVLAPDSSTTKFLISAGASADPAWAQPFQFWNFTAQTANYSAVAGDFVTASTNSFTVTLPTASLNTGKSIAIQKTDADISKVITISPNLNGASRALYTQYETVVVVSDGTNWQVASHYISSESIAYTPTGGAVSTNATFSGYWQRKGDSVVVRAKCAFSGTNTQGILTFTMPANMSIDTTKILTATNDNSGIGSALVADVSVTTYQAVASYVDQTTFRVRQLTDDLGAGSLVGSTIFDTSSSPPMTVASGDFVMAFVTVPITGWWG